jgi:hypothetical protein
MRADFAMPLPKSILCNGCKKTYPEGWRRCPYCGHDEKSLKQDAPARKFMARKVQEFEQKTASTRRQGARPGRPQPQKQQPKQQQQRPPQQQQQQQQYPHRY